MAVTVTLSNLANLQNDSTAVGVINANNAAITTAFADVLSRSGSSPNTMTSNLDMNNNRLVNLPSPVSPTDPIRLGDLTSSVTLATSGTAISLTGSVTGSTTLIPLSSASGTLTVPSATDTLVGKATTDTLTNKTFDTASNTFKFRGTSISSSVGSTTGSSVVLVNATLGGGTSVVLANSVTGTGAVVLSSSPTISGLSFGGTTNFSAVGASSVNKVTITQPAASSVLTIANAKTATFNNTMTFAGSDATTLTFQSTDTYVGRATTDTLTNKTLDTAGPNTIMINGRTVSSVTGSGSSVVMSFSPTFSTSIILNGATSGTITFQGFTGTYSLLLPTTAGTSGQILVSQAGTSSMTWAGGNSSLGIGFTAFSTSLGVITSSFTLDPTKANIQAYTNNGAHTLTPSTSVSTMVVDITNTSAAGTITTSNFTKVDGDTFDTTNGHSFRVYISVGSNGSSHLNVKRMV